MTMAPQRGDGGELVYFGTAAAGTRIFGLSMQTIAKVAGLVGLVIFTLSLGSGVVRWVLVGLLALGVIGLGVVRFVLGLHPLALATLRLRARLDRHRPGFLVESGLLTSLATRRIIGGLEISGHTPALSLRAQAQESDDWVFLLNEAVNRLDPQSELTLRSSILPVGLFEDLSGAESCYRELALGSYRISTSLIVASPPGHPRRQRLGVARTLKGISTLGGLEGIVVTEPADPATLVGRSCGRLSEAFVTSGAQLAESVDLLVGEEFAASVFRVDGWPGRSVDPRVLLPLFGPGQPSRVLALTMRGVDSRVAQRQVARHRTEMVADRKLRRERGYLDRVKDDHGEAGALSQEDELLAGFRLCRYRLLVVLLAPTPQGLITNRSVLNERAASAQLRLTPCLGRQRTMFERALVGVPGWS